MRTVCGSKTFNKFQTFERSLHFSFISQRKRQRTYKILKEIKVPILV